jgi:hypothetical protein
MFTQSLVCAVLLIGNPAPNTLPTNEEIRDAVSKLDHDDYRVRSQAAKRLLNAGKDSIAPLAKVAESGSIEAVDRAMKILAELSFNSNEATMAAAREALHKLAKTDGKSSDQARAILQQHRSKIMDRMQEAGATFQFDGDKVRAVYLDRVEELKAALPLLRELPELEEVSISNKQFDDTGMKHLLPLKNLKWLNLYQSSIGDESLKLLKNFPKLESIPMGGTKVTDAGLIHVADLTQLEYLGLRGNNVTDRGLVHLKKLTNLTGLTLQETKVTDAGLVHLQTLKSLNYLRLQSTAITDAGLEHLKDLKDLRRLDASNTKITQKGAEKLQAAIPGLTVATKEDQ